VKISSGRRQLRDRGSWRWGRGRWWRRRRRRRRNTFSSF